MDGDGNQGSVSERLVFFFFKSFRRITKKIVKLSKKPCSPLVNKLERMSVSSVWKGVVSFFNKQRVARELVHDSCHASLSKLIKIWNCF